MSFQFLRCFPLYGGGVQTEEAYSTCGRTRVLYANSLTCSFLVFTFLLMKPSVLFALPVIFHLCDDNNLDLERCLRRDI